MAGRGSSSFQKRLKEQKRIEKRQEKTAKRQDRKTDKPAGGLDSMIAERSSAEELREELAAEEALKVEEALKAAAPKPQ